MRILRKTSRKLRSVREFVRGLAGTDHPLLVHVVPIRRCNIDCGYCNEYDKVSEPVETAQMIARIDKLASLGTSVVAFSGGEPMLHPDLDELIRRIRTRGMIAGLITNGYLLSAKAHRCAERGRARLPADQHRQRRARSRVEEEPPAARHEIEVAGRARPLRYQHQFRRGWRNQEPGGCPHHQHASPAVGLFDVDRHHPRRFRPAQAARVGRTRGVRRRHATRSTGVARCSRISTPASASSRRIWRTATQTSGTAAPVRAICISARRASCTGARSNAVHRESRWTRIRCRIFNGNSWPLSGAPRCAPSAAFTVCPRWTTGASRRVVVASPRDTDRQWDGAP